MKREYVREIFLHLSRYRPEGIPRPYRRMAIDKIFTKRSLKWFERFEGFEGFEKFERFEGVEGFVSLKGLLVFCTSPSFGMVS